VALTRVARGDAIAAVSGTAEEMGAVLEGRFTLVCGEESHSLSVGDGILVPRGEPRSWRLDSDHGVLYRVWRHADAAP
jgi:mannose-6-phosphate isomerase-like protein (cupin superfamily)